MDGRSIRVSIRVRDASGSDSRSTPSIEASPALAKENERLAADGSSNLPFLSNEVMQAQDPPAPAQFDFTRRKRWQDILVTELAGCFTIVLSVQGKVLFCTRSVRELLGYRETDLLDSNLVDYIHESDQNTYMWQLSQTLRTLREFDCVLRFREKRQTNSTTPPFKCMEVKAIPRLQEMTQTCSCVVATCRPYPSKHMEVYQSIIDLKLENERLTKALAEQPEVQVEPHTAPLVQSSWRPSSPQYTRYAPPPGLPPFMQSSQSLPNVLDFTGMMPLNFNTVLPSLGPPLVAAPGPSSSRIDAPLVHVQRSSTMDVDHYEQPKKKRRTFKQLVCSDCGRTDSPEWRKGPLGPKTLCNACGLRYSKKRNEVAGGGAGSSALP